MPYRRRRTNTTPRRNPSRTSLVLVRHAHTSANTGDGTASLCGWSDLPLTDRGWSQVDHLGSRFRKAPVFTAIYSSPLRRAWNTARAVGSSEIEGCPGLREISCGLLDGMPLAEVQRRFPDIWNANLRQEDLNFRWPGGESYLDFRRRCLNTVRELASKHQGGTIALVTHAGVISQIVGFLHGASPAEWGRFRPGNTGVTEITWESGDLVNFDDRSHLPLELA